MMGEMKTSCQCEDCVSCCNNNPGWFLPGEAEKSAKLLNMSFEKFKNKYLIQEYWCGEPEIDVLAPRKINQPEGFSRARWGSVFERSPCIFLTERNYCQIHESKPYECKKTFGCREPIKDLRKGIALEWAKLP